MNIGLGGFLLLTEVTMAFALRIDHFSSILIFAFVHLQTSPIQTHCHGERDPHFQSPEILKEVVSVLSGRAS